MPLLIPNWRRAWRMASVQVATVAVAWGSLPADTQAAVLDAVGLSPSQVPLVLGVLMLLARVVNQPSTRVG